jgi:hypothetical protein
MTKLIFGPDDELEVDPNNIITSDPFANAPVIFSYTWQQGVADGILQPIWQLHWKELTGRADKPLLATTNLIGSLRKYPWMDDGNVAATLMAFYAMYLSWFINERPHLAEEDQMFVHSWNDETIWVIDDGTTITMLLPEDY